MVEKQLPSTVHNHFHIVKLFKEQELGHGSFATVCQARCDDLPCAAKVLHAGFFNQQDPDPGEDTFISRFVEECKILPSITHPNIVQCFGTYQDPDTDLPVLMMELMDESLTNYIERFRDPLPYHIEVCFSYDIALGLSYLHSRGYVHRDLSSNNVLIMAGVRAKITDFGMCRAMTGPSYRQTRLTLCPGTQPFMPPEALIDPPIYTDKLDIFSLGAVMIQIMSRQYPNPGPAHRQLRTMLHQAIPEEERRSNHIKLINQGHQMLPLVKQCIRNSYRERPSSQDVCNSLRSLKESHDYQQSKDQESVERKLENASQLHEADCQRLQSRHQQEIARIKVEHEAHCQRIQARHQLEIDTITEQHSKDIQEQRANIEAAHSHELQQLRQLQHLKNLMLPLGAVHSQALSALPPHGLLAQRQQSAQLPCPAMQEQDLQLQHQQDYQSNGRCSSASDVKNGQSDHQWHQPPPNPLLQQTRPPIAVQLHIQPPIMQGKHLSRQDNQNLLPNRCRSSAPDVRNGQSDHQWRQPPPSPLLQQTRPPTAVQCYMQPPTMEGQHLSRQDNQNLLPFRFGLHSSAHDVQSDHQWRQPPRSPLIQQHNMPIVSPNYNLDNTIDKSQGKGIINVWHVPDADPFDPLSLPEPAFDTHDLEMFQQEDRKPEGFCGHISMLINPRSDDYDDFSGPDLDDHLAYRSHDSGHMGLSELSTGSALKKLAEEKDEKESDSCMSDSLLIPIPDIPCPKEDDYTDVVMKKDDSYSGALFQISDDTSLDQLRTMYFQGAQQSILPVARPRSHSGGEKELKQQNHGSLSSDISMDSKHPHQPQYPPLRPVRKPVAVPRKGLNPCNKKSNESSKVSGVHTTNKDNSTEDENAATDVYIPKVHENSLLDNETITLRHITELKFK